MQCKSCIILAKIGFTLTLTSSSGKTLDFVYYNCGENIFVIDIVANFLEHFLHQFSRFGEIFREKRVRVDFKQDGRLIRRTVANSHLVSKSLEMNL